jgi:hypothetical protein
MSGGGNYRYGTTSRERAAGAGARRPRAGGGDARRRRLGVRRVSGAVPAGARALRRRPDRDGASRRVHRRGAGGRGAPSVRPAVDGAGAAKGLSRRRGAQASSRGEARPGAPPALVRGGRRIAGDLRRPRVRGAERLCREHHRGESGRERVAGRRCGADAARAVGASDGGRAR